MRDDLREDGDAFPGSSRRRGDRVWDAVLDAVGICGGNYAGVCGLTFAELLTVARSRRREEWDKAAFISSYAINANPYLKKPIDVRNPYREPPKPIKVRLEDVAALS